MAHASEHTRLMNKFIGLCKNTDNWPDTLRRLKYRVKLIEQDVSLESSERVAPDVVAVSGKYLHAIVADCKSGNNIEKQQDAKYRQIEPSCFRNVGVYDSKRLTHVVCYVDNESNHASLEPHTKLPFITFGQDAITGTGDFKNRQTTTALQKEIPLKNMREPTVFYPFAYDDEDKFVVPHVLTGMLDYMNRKRKLSTPIQSDAAAKKILELIHPFYAQIYSKYRRRLINRIKDIIKFEMRRNSKFKKQVLKIESGEYSTATMQSFNDTCQKIVDHYRHKQQQRRIDAYQQSGPGDVPND